MLVETRHAGRDKACLVSTLGKRAFCQGSNAEFGVFGACLEGDIRYGRYEAHS